MKGLRERSVETHLIAMKAAGQPEIFMFINNIWIPIFIQHVQSQGLARYQISLPQIHPRDTIFIKVILLYHYVFKICSLCMYT